MINSNEESKGDLDQKPLGDSGGTTISDAPIQTGTQESIAGTQQITMPPEAEAHKQLELPKVLEPIFGWCVRRFGLQRASIGWIFGTVFLAFLSSILSLGWTWALWDSYQPKITVTPGPTFNPKEPFETVFIIQNQGALPIRNITFNSTWIYEDDADQRRNVKSGIKNIRELQPLEQHALINPAHALVNVDLKEPIPDTNQLTELLTPPPGAMPMPTAHHSIVMWFDVSYKPQCFGIRTSTAYFCGFWDSETNFQWVPTGHADIREDAFDAAQLKKALNLRHALQNQITNSAKPSVTNASGTNNIQITNNISDTNQIHTNQNNPVPKVMQKSN